METILNNCTELLILLFLVVTFLQSGLDKITDWNGNLCWLKGHFVKTILKNMVPFALSSILVLELVASVLCIVGIVDLINSGSKTCGLLGAVVSSITLLLLLLGQRIAKDYDGARTIAIYFIPTIFGVFLLSL